MSPHRCPPLGRLREERLARSVHSLDAIAAPRPRVDPRVDASLLLVSVASEALLDGARVDLADFLDRASLPLALASLSESTGRLPASEERALKGLQNLETDLTRLHVPFTLILPRVKTHDHRSRGDTPWRAQTLDVALTLNEGSTRARSAPNFLAQGPQEGSTCTTVSFKSSYYSGVGSPLDAGRCGRCAPSRFACACCVPDVRLFATMWGKD